MTQPPPDPNQPGDGTMPPPPPPPYQQPGSQQPGYQQPGYPAPSPGAPVSQSDERLWATLAHAGGIILGFIAPLVVWLIYRERSAYLDDQGKEALNFQITVLIGWVAVSILAGVTFGIGGLLWFVVAIGNLVLCIMAAIAANKGERYRYPFALRLIK
jgi:uncharacterized Tic20 family protein